MLNNAFIPDLGRKNRNTIPNNSPSVKASIDALQLPKTSFRSWTGFRPITVPSSVSVYQLKNGYTLVDVKTLAHKLSAFDTVKDYKDFVMSYTIGKKGQAAAWLLFNKNTGEFSYTATDGVPLSPERKPVEEKIYEFLNKIGWHDPTLKIVATYKLRDDPEATYYEIKRDWDETGMPILNPIGLLNLDDTQSISNLELNDRSTALSQNRNIYDTSDNKDGLDRNADFNTMTLGLSDLTENVVVLKSNVRKLENQDVSTVAPISYDKAVALLKNNQEAFVLTTPANIANMTDWQKIYPNQLAEADEAIITESAIAYLEQSPGAQQPTLEPHFIFRGRARLTNNYEINFIAAVPAVEKTQAFKTSPFSFSLIPQVYAANGTIGQIGSQKQGDFELTITPAPPSTPTPAFGCIPSKENLNPYNEINPSSPIGYGWSPIAIINGEVRISKKGWWYYVPPDGTNETTLIGDVNLVWIQIRTITGVFNRRNFSNDPPPNILSDFRANGINGIKCPIRVTGDSPTIFIYAPANYRLSIKPPSSITYAEPLLQKNEWNILSDKNGSLLVNDLKRDFVYYEYSDVTFSRPDKGWIVKKDEIDSFANTLISPVLKLNKQEQSRLVYELKHAAGLVHSDRLFIGSINRNELDTKLPVTITPRPAIYRYFFYVGMPTGHPYQTPKLSPIVRTEYMTVELGSYAEK